MAGAETLREQYERDGFVIVKNLLSSEEVTQTIAEMLAVVNGERGTFDGIIARKGGETDDVVQSKVACIHFPHKISPALKAIAAEHEKTIDV